MIERLKCPVCAWEHRLMPVSMRSVTWGDCACTDIHNCVYHTLHLEVAKRPSDEEMEKRRLELEAHQRQKFEALRQRMKEYDKLCCELVQARERNGRLADKAEMLESSQRSDWGLIERIRKIAVDALDDDNPMSELEALEMIREMATDPEVDDE